MSGLWLYRALSRVPLVGYRGKIVGLAAIAAAFPFFVLVGPAGEGADAKVAWAMAATILSLLLLTLLLHPIGLAARGLRECVAGEGAPDLPAEFPDEAGRMMADVRQMAMRLESLGHRLTNRHPVTGLPTREPFLTVLEEDTGAESEAVVLGVVRFSDYDRLAAFDQDAADLALKTFADRLRDAVGASRPLAQVDRDCFAIWFRGAGDPQSAAGEFQALGYVLAQEMGDAELKLTPDVRLGAAIFPHDGADPTTLLTRAFAALPKAGGPGHGKPAFFSPESSATARARFSLEQSLRRAISREEFLLYFQPVIDLTAGAVVGAEALLRWRHPERGLVAPGEFIPVLEQSGMIDEVGLWVLNTACREARAWEDLGLKGLKMAVNLSARQFRDPALNTMIIRTLERHRLAPESLELELTETATMEDAHHTSQLFGELRAMGVSVAIDDFGTGYSSLSYLKKLPFSKLKIDREFVTKLDERRDSHAICTALVALARGLDISVLAEGVETREELDTLRNLGCDMFQGFFFAKPLPAEAFVRTVSDPDWLALLNSPVHREIADLNRRVQA
jgi:EAL domain-containing protein (putative c-di-GMP-specific phosphodiesterase class I)/GGDEF domain-containing protein